MIRRKLAILAVAALASSGCYHATINTGMPMGAESTHSTWKHSWIYGLVPPSQVNATEVCNGQPAARVETQLSFVNQLVSAVTGGIYTPMTVKVTCAAPQ